jgi:hypothetical protein
MTSPWMAAWAGPGWWMGPAAAERMGGTAARARLCFSRGKPRAPMSRSVPRTRTWASIGPSSCSPSPTDAVPAATGPSRSRGFRRSRARACVPGATRACGPRWSPRSLWLRTELLPSRPLGKASRRKPRTLAVQALASVPSPTSSARSTARNNEYTERSSYKTVYVRPRWSGQRGNSRTRSRPTRHTSTRWP